MFDRLSAWVLRLMRVPHDPAPPFGAPGSIRVFRAGRKYYTLRLLGWGLGQVVGVIGICFSILFLNWLDAGAPRFSAMLAEQKAAKASAPAAAPAPPPAATPAPAATAPATPPPLSPAELERIPEGKRPPLKALKPAQRRDPNVAIRNNMLRVASQSSWVLPLLHFFEYFAILGFLLQVPVSFAIVRLEFEQHWYIVTDRSLRIRTGLWNLQESTMSFANLQQVEMKQGPLQRFLGLGDVHVQSAGGGGDHNPHHAQGDSLHTGIFHNVENAEEIRDLILARLRQFRQAGLGDHDDPQAPAAPGGALHAPAALAANSDVLAAARELLAEARALRQA